MTEEQSYYYWLAVHALADSEESATMTKGDNNGETQQTNNWNFGERVLQEVSNIGNTRNCKSINHRPSRMFP
ncbi:MAG: hypothetical protein GX966_09710 [Jeotgalicoccus halophilus]|nr:hypothetical protein [Jeotgalicoccus aerolatus]